MLQKLRTAVPLLVTGLAVLLVQVWLQAQSQAPEGFVQMTPEEMAARETIPAAPLLLAAYAVVWVVLVGYVFLLWRRLGRVEQELADVRSRLQADHER